MEIPFPLGHYSMKLTPVSEDDRMLLAVQNASLCVPSLLPLPLTHMHTEHSVKRENQNDFA